MSKTRRTFTIDLDIGLLLITLIGIIISLINPLEESLVETGYSSILYFGIYVNALLFITTIFVLISLFKDSESNINNTAYLFKYITTVLDILLFVFIFFIFASSLSFAGDKNYKMYSEYLNSFILNNSLLFLVSPVFAFVTTFKLERHDIDLKWYHCFETIIPAIIFLLIYVYKTLYATNKWVDGLAITDEDFLLKVDPIFLGLFLFVSVVISFIFKGIANNNYTKTKKDLIVDIVLLFAWIFASLFYIILNNTLPISIVLVATIIVEIIMNEQRVNKSIGHGPKREINFDGFFSSGCTSTNSNMDYINSLYEDSQKNFEYKPEPEMSLAEREEKEYWEYDSYNNKDNNY